ncbi:MAG: hypothetical protein AAB947_01525 [Patescibacteria group bacterium]
MKTVDGEHRQIALLASYEKDEKLIRIGKLLHEAKWKLLGSAGTAKFLNENSIPCRDVAEIVGKPILGHRVVTLSRELHAALLSTTADFKELVELGIEPIDLVYVTLYPLEEAIARGALPAEVTEKTDIGGPTILRSAAKGGRLALSNSSQIVEVENWIAKGSNENERIALAEKFAAAAERRVADYVDASAQYWESKIK